MYSFITINHQRIAYLQEGEGFPLVLLHGFCEDSSMWDDFVVDLLPNYQVIRVDLSGFGQSDLSKNVGIEYMADSVHAVLMHLGIEQCVMIGHSMGGYVTLSFAERYSDFLQGIGLFHSHPFADTKEKIKNRKRAMKFVLRYGVSPFVGQMIPMLFANEFVKENPNLIEELISTASEYHKDTILDASEAMILRKDRCFVLEQLNCPVLLIVGKKDNAVPFENSSKMLDLASLVDVRILEDVGHMGMYEAKEETLGMVLDFMELCEMFKKITV